MNYRTAFDNELEKLHKDVMKMSTLIEQSLDNTILALENKDKDLALKIIEDDDKIDNCESEIELECLRIIAKQQPVAKDLRNVTSILKMITDLERIGDNCSDISQYIIRIADDGAEMHFDHITAMAIQVKKMLTSTINCFVNNDAVTAKATALEDDIVDDYFEQLIVEIQSIMMTSKDLIVCGTYYIFVIKYLERMADHCTNVCEWVEYRVNGEHDSHILN